MSSDQIATFLLKPESSGEWENLGNLHYLFFCVALKIDNQGLYSRRFCEERGGAQHSVQQESSHMAPT